MKGGINIKEYECIFSFQMFIDKEDTIQLHGSIVINNNQTQLLRIFFINESIIYFYAKQKDIHLLHENKTKIIIC